MNLKTLFIKRLANSKSTRKLRSTRQRERSTPTYQKAKTPKLQTMEKTKSFNLTFLWNRTSTTNRISYPKLRNNYYQAFNLNPLMERQIIVVEQFEETNGRIYIQGYSKTTKNRKIKNVSLKN